MPSLEWGSVLLPLSGLSLYITGRSAGGKNMVKVDYKAVIEDLKSQRAEIDRTIAFFEKQLASGRRSGEAGGAEGSDSIESDTFHGKNILQATEKYLRMMGRPARSTEDIAAALNKGGLTATPGSVATILGRSKDSQVQRVKRGLWGLAEWYTGEK
jgi:hypothetical protein